MGEVGDQTVFLVFLFFVDFVGIVVEHVDVVVVFGTIDVDTTVVNGKPIIDMVVVEEYVVGMVQVLWQQLCGTILEHVVGLYSFFPP